MTAGRRAGAGRERGQLGFDFMVGMAVFLLTLGFLLSFLPGTFEPFERSGGQDMITADRSAARLAEELLVEDRTDPNLLNGTCTAEFFDSDGATGACRFDTDGNDLNAALGVQDTSAVNATIEHNGSIITHDAVVLAAGEEPPAEVGITVSQRVVLLDGQDRRLIVRVW